MPPPNRPSHPSSKAASAPGRARALPLVLLAMPWLLALVLEVTPEHATLLGVSGPPCVAGTLLGGPGCPGCGLTRAWAFAVRGDLAAAAALNPAVFLLMAVTVAGVLIHARILARGFKAPADARWLGLGTLVAGLGVLLIWTWRWLLRA